MKYPTVRILSTNLEMLGVLSSYTSLRHKRSWQGVGDFEIHTSDYDPELIKPGNFIMLDNAHKNGVITAVKCSYNSNKMDVTITGTTLDGLSSRRIVMPWESDPNDPDIENDLNHLNGGYFCYPYRTKTNKDISPEPAETLLKVFAQQGFGWGDAERGFPNLAYITDHCQNAGKSSVWMSRYEQLDEVLQSISEYCDIGWEIYPVLSGDKYLAFNVLPGVDRSAGQSKNSRVIISKEFGSAADITYSVDYGSYKNVAYAAGRGDDADRLVIAVTNDENTPMGYDRYECFEDCGTLEAVETDEDISIAEEGRHKLTSHEKQESLTATLTTSGAFAYGTDYDLGDLVTVSDKDIGIEQDMRLTEVEESYEANTIQVRGVLGTSAAHLGRVIRSYIPTAR